MDRAAAAWRLLTTVAGASERGIRVAMRLLRALQLTICMCAGTTEACFDISLLHDEVKMYDRLLTSTESSI